MLSVYSRHVCACYNRGCLIAIRRSVLLRMRRAADCQPGVNRGGSAALLASVCFGLWQRTTEPPSTCRILSSAARKTGQNRVVVCFWSASIQSLHGVWWEERAAEDELQTLRRSTRAAEVTQLILNGLAFSFAVFYITYRFRDGFGCLGRGKCGNQWPRAATKPAAHSTAWIYVNIIQCRWLWISYLWLILLSNVGETTITNYNLLLNHIWIYNT